jgi:phage-related protein
MIDKSEFTVLARLEKEYARLEVEYQQARAKALLEVNNRYLPKLNQRRFQIENLKKYIHERATAVDEIQWREDQRTSPETTAEMKAALKRQKEAQRRARQTKIKID